MHLSFDRTGHNDRRHPDLGTATPACWRPRPASLTTRACRTPGLTLVLACIGAAAAGCDRQGATTAATASTPEDTKLLGALDAPDWSTRRSALDQLAKNPPIPAPYVPRIIAALEDDNVDVRHSARQAVAAMGSTGRAAVDALLRGLAGDDRRYLPEALVAIAPEDPRVLDALKGQLLSGDALRANHARRALAAAGKPAVAVLVEALKTQNLTAVREAAGALGELGPVAAEATPTLFAVATELPAGGNEGARLAIEQALRRIAPQDPSVRALVCPDDGEACCTTSQDCILVNNRGCCREQSINKRFVESSSFERHQDCATTKVACQALESVCHQSRCVTVPKGGRPPTPEEECRRNPHGRWGQTPGGLGCVITPYQR